MRNYLLPIVFLLIFSSHLYAQKDVDIRGGDPSFLDRVYVGGGLGFATSNNATFISVSPIVGYMITQNLSAGVGIQYQYIKYKFSNITTDSYGGSIFTRYNISQFFLQTEYNTISFQVAPGTDNKDRRSYDRLLFGGGISQPLGRRARLNILGMYDVIYNANSPFASPWVFRVFVSM